VARTSQAKIPVALSVAERATIRRALLTWYGKNRRALPWRNVPTPYAVWVSEVMLQQTRVEVVRDYFARWMKLFPTLEALARADESAVLHAWQGLGYYSRARRLREGARYVVENYGGQLPTEPEQLTRIPGIGPYSAGAISSIAYGKPSPIVDGNVIRVLARFFALPGDPNKSPLKKELWRLAAELVPSRAASDFNQSLMEVGALVCTPKSPACYSCPLSKSCAAHASAQVHRFPELPERKKPTPLSMVVVLLSIRGRYAIQKLPLDARWWAGLDALPFGEVRPDESLEAAAIRAAKPFATLKGADLSFRPPIFHTVTRYKISLTPVVVCLKSAGAKRPGASGGGAHWVPPHELPRLALPAPHQKALRVLL
jgi:A/G-specific adenine glycosylase